MATRLDFELALLDDLSDAYRTAALGELGMTFRESAPREGALRFLGGAVRLSRLVALLGEPFATERLHPPDPYAGSTAHYFRLGLWPHLEWCVFGRGDDACAGYEFRNQRARELRSLDPALVRPGIWCEDTLTTLADDWALHDGWNERHVLRLSFGGQRYEGTFVWGLLHTWRPLGEPGGDG